MPRPSSRRISVIVIRWSLALILGLALATCALLAQEPPRSYTFVLASGFLCDPDHAEACPAVAKDANGSTFEMSGAGVFDAQSRSVEVAGTFTHKSPNGIVLETGVWLASELVSFDSYGAAPGALKRQGVAFGPPFGRRRMLMSSGPMPTGGLAIFRIRLLPMQGPPTNAVLQVNCGLGEVLRERSVEGIRLRSEENRTDYAEEVGGRVMILAVRPGVVAPAKTPHRATSPAIPESPQN
jgi:hypothetical protein